jgi:hypothetical protein
VQYIYGSKRKCTLARCQDTDCQDTDPPSAHRHCPQRVFVRHGPFLHPGFAPQSHRRLGIAAAFSMREWSAGVAAVDSRRPISACMVLFDGETRGSTNKNRS